MGFPTWTLWGMGLSVLGALIAIGLAYIAQSPRFLARTGLSGYRLDLRVRAFTGYAFALLLLAVGFFLAGVPLDAEVTAGVPLAASTVTTTAGSDSTGAVFGNDVAQPELTVSPTVTEAVATRATPASGAFGGPPEAAGAETPTVAAGDEETPAPEIAPTEPLPTPAPTDTPSPTSTPSPTPTPTETPTPTPTPIEGETAVVRTAGSTVWVRRTPGGPNVALVNNRDLVIVLPGRANYGGILWREVSTVTGEVGWIQEEFLVYE